MRNLSPRLIEAFKHDLRAQGIDSGQEGDLLKWLRYYLDFCAKYDEPPRDSDSLEPFLQKLASKRQTPTQQNQAAESVQLYYKIMQNWSEEEGAQSPHEASVDNSWLVCYQTLKEEILLRHYSRSTLKTYRGWVRQFQYWLKGKAPDSLNSSDARSFLTHLAVDRHVAASTQNQAFNALLFFYRHIIHSEYDIGEKVVRAKRRKYIPVVLSRKEVDAIVSNLVSPYRLIVQLLYGCGLRKAECLNLRVQDLNFDAEIITIHDGKGGKDRTVPLPGALTISLEQQLAFVREVHAQDMAAGYHGAFMPTALNRKWKQAAKEYGWQWVFPSQMLTSVPADNELRRHHLHPSNLQRALHGARTKAGATCKTIR